MASAAAAFRRNSLADASSIFARNRAHGLIDLSVGADPSGRTRRNKVAEAGSLRVRLPDPSGLDCEAVILNTAGGIAGGDDFSISVAAAAQSRLTVTTAAAEKVYRAMDTASRVAVRLSIAAGASLRWLPQETILFDGAKLNRSIEVDVVDESALLLVESTIFGRSAMGETVRGGELADRWRIRRNGTLVFADTLRLSGDISALLARPAAGAGATAFATVVVAPAEESLAATMRECLDRCSCECGVSAWSGIAVVRLCAGDAALLRRDLISVLRQLGGPLPRLWMS